MKFQLTIKVQPGHDISELVVQFEAPLWKDTPTFAEKFIQQIGLPREACSTEIVYGKDR